jgi:hypothetical protein
MAQQPTPRRNYHNFIDEDWDYSDFNPTAPEATARKANKYILRQLIFYHMNFYNDFLL